jgi:hypothetical protein
MASPTNASGTGRPSSSSMAGTGRHLVSRVAVNTVEGTLEAVED